MTEEQQRLVEKYMYLIDDVWNECIFKHSVIDSYEEDIKQQGMIGLMNAIVTAPDATGKHLIDCLKTYIFQEMMQCICDVTDFYEHTSQGKADAMRCQQPSFSDDFSQQLYEVSKARIIAYIKGCQ